MKRNVGFKKSSNTKVLFTYRKSLPIKGV